MCGITGVLNLGTQSPPARHTVESMLTPLVHRGPDDTGFFNDQHICLGHVRLSIIDLETGQQPVHNETKSVWIIFNGEIFNYIELRDSLEKLGHSFYTKSDTEVLVHLYEEYGEDFIHHLNGQFAIALWDTVRKKLLLIRDRVGILPLFYCRYANRLFFSSEVKGILAGTDMSVSLNLKALDQLMTFWSPVSPDTVFEHIYEVSPGQMLCIQDGVIKKKTYWDWSFPVDGDFYQGNEDRIAGELHDLLVDSTTIRLRSDVPVGAYLSGGLDSSSLLAMMHHYGGVGLRTFSIGFSEQSFDESSFQKTMIDHLGTEHSRVECSNRDIGESFIDTIYHTESPVMRTAPVPMSILSQLVRSTKYKVVLTGEGADEVLGGYDLFKESKIRLFWAKQADSWLRPQLLKRLYPYLNITRNQGQAYLKSFFGTGLEKPDLSYFSHIPRWNTTAKCKEFFSNAVKEVLCDNAIDILEASLPKMLKRWHPFNRAQYIEAKSLMSGYLLCSQGDRMLMKNSVEGRFPFLDHRLIEFAATIHPKLKMKVLNEKYILKQAMKNYLPETVINRHKQPYRAPDIPAFFGERTPEYVDELLCEETVKKYGYFDPARVGRLVAKIRRGKTIGFKDNMALGGILSTQIWHYHFIENYQNTYSCQNV